MEPPRAAGLFERHHLAVYRFLRRATGDGPAAEDLTQDVFLRIVRGLDRYEDRLRERAWVFRIARNVLIDRHRRYADPQHHRFRPVRAHARHRPGDAVRVLALGVPGLRHVSQEGSGLGLVFSALPFTKSSQDRSHAVQPLPWLTCCSVPLTTTGSPTLKPPESAVL